MAGLSPEDPGTQYLVVDKKKLLKEQGPYDAKKDCWIVDEKDGFLRASIESSKGDDITVKIQKDSTSRTVKKDLIQQMNPPKYEKIEDMANMTYLNEACVLHNLAARYRSMNIYTYSGLFCVTVNPYKRLPIYTQSVIDAYKGRRKTEMPPHLFSVADNAYQNMLQDRENQSCLITGESGAGKTENTKKVIMYLANVAAAPAKKGEEENKKGNLEDQIVQTNPVLEAYGNAKTTRNNNSSRFGKFIRIHFGTTGKIAGADIETYLLEKSRVTACGPLERNYHIYYQLMCPALPELTKMILADPDPALYNFCNQGVLTVDGIDDIAECKDMNEAFGILGFSEEEKNSLFKCTGATMHFGQMQFKQRGKDEQAEADGTADAEKVAFLLGINANDLLKALLKPKIKVGTEFVTKAMNLNQVTNSVNSLSRSLYDRMFAWLVKRVNKTLDTNNKRQNYIGVLDIAGFEIFDFNSFDQLCINYTNERLQQFFNHHMFVLEQEEYKKEGIDWEFIDFGMDLEASIVLIEKPMGILSILEEECMFPKASDKTFIDKLNGAHLGKSKAYGKASKPKKPGLVQAHFELHHYAGSVPYNITNWLEKNKDPMNETVGALLSASKEALVRDHLFPAPPEEPKGGGGGKKKKSSSFQTISSVHKESLNKLMKNLYSTHPHFVRCIIPNENKCPGEVDAHLVMHQLQCNGVLEGIRICRKGFPSRIPYSEFKTRYSILAPNAIPEGFVDGKKVTGNILEALQLDNGDYRLGTTKVFFKAGVLGTLEEMRDERLSKIIGLFQAQIRGFLTRKNYKQMQDRRDGLSIIQRNIRKWLGLKNWLWWRLYVKVKPLLEIAHGEDELKQKEEELASTKEGLEKAEAKAKALEEQAATLAKAKDQLQSQLNAQEDTIIDQEERIEGLIQQKIEFDAKVKEMEDRLLDEEDALSSMEDKKKKMDAENAALMKDVEDLEGTLAKAESDKKHKDEQIGKLNDEIAFEKESVAKLSSDKKHLEEEKANLEGSLAAEEHKVSDLNKLKAKLEQTLDELEDGLEREKKTRGDVEKAKKKLEGDLKSTQSALEDMENAKRASDEAGRKKDMEIAGLNTKLEEESNLVAKGQKQMKELNAHIEEMEEELESQGQAKAKVEKQRAELARELEDLTERLEEAGSNTAAQMELNKKREAELAKLRRDMEESQMQNDAQMAAIRKKGQDAANELNDQVEALQKVKSRLDKEKKQLKLELDDAQLQLESASKNKGMSSEMSRKVEGQLSELNSRLDQASREVVDLQSAKNRACAESAELGRQLEESEGAVSKLTKERNALNASLEDAMRCLEDETRARQKLAGECRNLNADVAALQEQLEEEAEGRSDLQRQVSRATTEVQQWRIRFEQEGSARAEEFEESRRKLAAKLANAEEAAEAAQLKVAALEKAKSRMQGEMEDLMIDVERNQANAGMFEKKQRAFDKTISEWQSKCTDLQSELANAQQEARGYSAELFRSRAQIEESCDSLDALRRENKNLADEIHDMTEQLTEGGRSSHELEKSRKRLQMEKEELQAALEEAESALEQEEAKVMRAQLEIVSTRSEIDRRLSEKDEEFENTRRNFQRSVDSVQASLEAEAKGKAEALRIKKKLESDIAELEVALDGANRGKGEFERKLKEYQVTIRDMQSQMEDSTRLTAEARESGNSSERRITVLSMEIEELRTTVETCERARKSAENDLSDANDRVNEVSAQVVSITSQKRKLEVDVQAMQADLDEMSNELRASEDRAKKAMSDAARLADELRQEQEHSSQVEKLRKGFESQLKELQLRLEEAETQALKGGKKLIVKFETRVRELETELDNEQRRHAETQKAVRKADRRLKELSFENDEAVKNNVGLQDMIDKLQAKIKNCKRQVEEAEEVAAVNLSKYRKLQNELEDAEERADSADQQLVKLRAKNRGSSVAVSNSTVTEGGSTVKIVKRVTQSVSRF